MHPERPETAGSPARSTLTKERTNDLPTTAPRYECGTTYFQVSGMKSFEILVALC